MDFKKLKQISQAPETGWVLAYFVGGVEFAEYQKVDTDFQWEMKKTKEELGNLLELHLFNDEVEYRTILSGEGYIEKNIEAENDGKDSIVEQQFLEEKQGEKDVLPIVNSLTYDENGMVIVSHYRLKMPAVYKEEK